MLVVVKYAAFAQVVACAILLFFQCVFRRAEYCSCRACSRVPSRLRPQRRRALEHQVLEEMGSAILAGRLIECTHVGEYLADDPGFTGPLDDQEGQPAIEYVLA